MTILNEQTKLKAWMEEYALHRLLELEVSAGDAVGLPLDFSKEPATAEGQIRLWPAVDLQWPPMYGLLIRADYGCWRVFPFSELSFPAIPQELLVRSDPPVRVLQGWNARELPQAAVSQSWFVDTLAPEQMFRVNLWWLALASESPVLGDLQSLTGPPLRHPLDPRHEYLDAEACRADVCLGESPAIYHVGPEQRRAAEPEIKYGKNTENDPSE